MKPARARKPAPEPREIDDAALREFAGYNMKRAYLTLHADLLAVLDAFGLRVTTYSALLLIAGNAGLTQSQLAQALNIERSGVVLIVDDLESRELITRDRVPGDRRSYALRATLAGRRLRDKAVAQVRAHEARLLAGMTRDERAELIRLLGMVERGAAEGS